MLRVPRGGGQGEEQHAVGKDRAGPALALGDGEGRMWSLFPQTSSSNLNNSLHLPPAAPGIQLLELRDRTTTLPPGSRKPRGSATPLSPAWCPRAPAAPKGPEKGLWRGKRAPGRGMGPGRQPPACSRGPAGGARALSLESPRVP